MLAYVEELKIAALYQGIDPTDVDDLIKEGFSLDEVEEYIYDSELLYYS